MKVVILPGSSLANRDWSQRLAFSIIGQGLPVKMVNYGHWKNSALKPDWDAEYSSLLLNLKEEKNYAVIGKSAGTGLILRGLKENKIDPKACVFVGLPFATDRRKDIDRALGRIKVRSLFLQNDKDPQGQATVLKKIVGEIKMPHLSIESMKGNDHNYSSVEEIGEKISGFFREKN